MTEPTYRIEIKHDPHSVGNEWDAYVSYADGSGYHYVSSANTAEEAQKRALDWIAAEYRRDPNKRVLWATESGELCDAPEPQSLRA